MSIINTQLTADTTVSANGNIPLGNVIHKCGCGIKATSNALNIEGSGYFKITANATISVTGTTVMTVTLLDNGSAIASASAVPGAAGDEVNLTLSALIYKRCMCSDDSLTFVVNSAGTVNEFDVIVEAL